MGSGDGLAIVFTPCPAIFPAATQSPVQLQEGDLGLNRNMTAGERGSGSGLSVGLAVTTAALVSGVRPACLWSRCRHGCPGPGTPSGVGRVGGLSGLLLVHV